MFWMTLAFAGPTPVAVMAFDNNSGDARYDAVGFGLQDMLVTDLSVVDDLQLVERDRLSDVLDELELGQSAYVDPKTAARVGKVVSAKWVVTGGLIAMDPIMRLDARVVDVKTGKVIANAKTEGPTDEFFLLEKELASGLLDALDIEVSARASARMGRVQTENFDAFLSYAKGLEALDAGELERAAEALGVALSEDARFASAESVLSSFRDEVDELSATNVKVTSEMAQRLMDDLQRVERQKDWEALGRFVVELDPHLQSMPKDDWRIIGKQLLSMSYPEPFHPRETSKVTAREYAMYLVILADAETGRNAEALAFGKTFMERYPASVLFGNVKRTVDGLIARQEQELAGSKRADADIASETYKKHLERCKRHEDPRFCERASKFAQANPSDDFIATWIDAIETSGTIDDVGAFEGAVGPNDRLNKLLEEARTIRDAASTDPRDIKSSSIALYRLGEAKKAKKVILSTLTGSQEQRVWRDGLDAVRRFGGVDLATQLQDGAAAVGASYEAKRAVDEAARRAAAPGNFEPDELHVTAKVLDELKLFERSSAAFLELAERFPDYEPCPASYALYNAAWKMSQSNVEGKNTKARALYERVIDEHPDSKWVGPSKSILSTLSR